jgi:hypothetical protein
MENHSVSILRTIKTGKIIISILLLYSNISKLMVSLTRKRLMPKFKKGDRVRRVGCPNTDDMPVGSEWIVIDESPYGDSLALEGFRNGHYKSSRTYFELVKPEVTSPSYSCIKEIPAQAARTVIVSGGLTGKFYINAVDRGQIQLVKTECSGTWWNACELRDNAAAFIALADALDSQRS